jgi:alpha,alpha-trehalose phosphorylase
VVSSSRHCQAVIEAAGIADLFDARVDGKVSDELNLQGKPAPDIFLKAAELLHVSPDKAVVVEDATAGVAAGHKGGFGLVIGVDRKGDAEELRQHGADLVVKDLKELL